ncbi:zinc-binding dehydrogenase [Dactylosporangium sp. NPDC049525]|uniref:zinc-binding dehydrogenase n=1 Tax=Dactylosporangium sp. NPDC049525 TaxID=3154730 RepID=UPI00341649B2
MPLESVAGAMRVAYGGGVPAVEIVLPHAVEPEGLLLREKPIPRPGPHEALIRVEASGMSFDDMLMRRCTCLDRRVFPMVPGRDLVGVVTEAGAAADPGLVGRRVAAVVPGGGWATHVTVAAAALTAVPDGLGAVDAVALAYPGLLAWHMLHDLAGVRSGQVLAVPGAPGWVGTTLVQLAGHAGAQVIGVSSTRQLAGVTGLDFIPVDHWVEDVSERVRQLAPDGVDAVFDTIGGPTLPESWEQLNKAGILVSYGHFATRDVPGDPVERHAALVAQFDAWAATSTGRRAVVADLFAAGPPDPAWSRTVLSGLFEAATGGRLRPYVAATYPLGEAAAALREFEVGGMVGRVVLVND